MDSNGQPHITDFGLAKNISEEPEVTNSGDILGTPSYMPPEQAAGKRKEVTERSDVYSRGAILYDLVTGRPPFRADSPVETLRQVIDAEPAAPRLLNSRVPRDLETICLKCLRKRASDRYESAQDLADDVGRFLRREPIRARPVSALEKTWRWCHRKPEIALLVGMVAGLGLFETISAELYRQELLRMDKNVASVTVRSSTEFPEASVPVPRGHSLSRSGGRQISFSKSDQPALNP